MLVDVGSLEDFKDGAARVVDVLGSQVGIIRWAGSVYAVRNICPHQLGPVCAGRLLPSLMSDQAGVVASDRTKPVLVCAWHGWEFDVKTGRCSADPSYHVKTYKVVTDGGRVAVELSASAGEQAQRTAQVST